MMRRLLHTTAIALALALVLGVATAPAWALPDNHDNDTTRTELANFDRFLDAHPAIGRDLYRHPELVDNRDYVEDHPELREFLRNHPGVREEIRENPRAFMKRERKFEKSEERHERAATPRRHGR